MKCFTTPHFFFTFPQPLLLQGVKVRAWFQKQQSRLWLMWFVIFYSAPALWFLSGRMRTAVFLERLKDFLLSEISACFVETEWMTDALPEWFIWLTAIWRWGFSRFAKIMQVQTKNPKVSERLLTLNHTIVMLHYGQRYMDTQTASHITCTQKCAGKIQRYLLCYEATKKTWMPHISLSSCVKATKLQFNEFSAKLSTHSIFYSQLCCDTAASSCCYVNTWESFLSLPPTRYVNAT